MSAKKRKPLDSAMEAFVFGASEIETAAKPVAPTPPPAATPPAATPPAAPTPPPAVTPAAATPQPASEAAMAPAVTPAPTLPVTPPPSAIPVQPKENSLISKLQAPGKEATVRFTVDMSESLHRKLSVLAARTGRKKVDIVRMLLEDGLKEVDG